MRVASSLSCSDGIGYCTGWVCAMATVCAGSVPRNDSDRYECREGHSWQVNEPSLCSTMNAARSYGPPSPQLLSRRMFRKQVRPAFDRKMSSGTVAPVATNGARVSKSSRCIRTRAGLMLHNVRCEARAVLPRQERLNTDRHATVTEHF